MWISITRRFLSICSILVDTRWLFHLGKCPIEIMRHISLHWLTRKFPWTMMIFHSYIAICSFPRGYFSPNVVFVKFRARATFGAQVGWAESGVPTGACFEQTGRQELNVPQKTGGSSYVVILFLGCLWIIIIMNSLWVIMNWCLWIVASESFWIHESYIRSQFDCKY